MKTVGGDMMRARAAVLLCLGVAACAPSSQYSSSEYGDYNSYMRNHANGAAAQNGYDGTSATSGGFSIEGANAALDRAQGGSTASYSGGGYADASPTQGAMIGGSASGGTGYDGARPRGNAPAGIREESGEMIHATGSHAGISDEQDFKAVSARETIASDKERIERNRAQYQVIAPTAVPQRTGDEGVNIVQFAMQTSHPVGTMMYSRGSILPKNQARACAKFASPDQAQQWFLENGGPAKDRRGLDPDGDGYACAWDPTPFRS